MNPLKPGLLFSNSKVFAARVFTRTFYFPYNLTLLDSIKSLFFNSGAVTYFVLQVFAELRSVQNNHKRVLEIEVSS